MVGVIGTHVLLYTAPGSSRAAGALYMLLHVNREVFFFVSAFVLAYSTGAARRRFDVVRFWRRRYPLVVVPYLAWTVVYWLLVTEIQAPGHVPSPQSLLDDLATGWLQLYFLLVTMQVYLVFPLLAWMVRRTLRFHWLVLLVSAAFQLSLDWIFEYRPGMIPAPVFGAALWAQNELTSYLFYLVAGVVAAAHWRELVDVARAHRRHVVLAALCTIGAGELVYAWNLHAGYLPDGASADLQPAVLPLVLAALALLWSAADWLAETVPGDTGIWPAVRRGADQSYGVFLAHMLPVVLLLQPGVEAILQPRGMTWEQLAILRLALTAIFTLLLVAVLRRTPLSLPLTGRGRHRRPPRVIDATAA